VKDVYDVGFVNAAAWLVTRECLEKVGGFSPSFFHYGEDASTNNRSRMPMYRPAFWSESALGWSADVGVHLEIVFFTIADVGVVRKTIAVIMIKTLGSLKMSIVICGLETKYHVITITTA
jgi:hypothetical protein